MHGSAGRVEAVETADGHKLFFPEYSDISPEDPEYPNAIRPDRIRAIIRLRHTHNEVEDLSVFTPAEVDAIYHPWMPLTGEEAAHVIKEQESLTKHPLRTTLKAPSLLLLSPFGKWIPPLVSRLGF